MVDFSDQIFNACSRGAGEQDLASALGGGLGCGVPNAAFSPPSGPSAAPLAPGSCLMIAAAPPPVEA